MDESRPVGTPTIIGCKLCKQENLTEVNETLYRYMIGKLQYGVHNRPDITHVVRIVAIFSTNP